MRTLDKIDIEILHHLVADARQPYSEIAERIDVSAPTVSNRVDRLVDLGVIDGFTVDVDRSTVSAGTEVLIDCTLSPDADDGIADRLSSFEEFEHVFATADGRVLATATISQARIRAVLADAVDLESLDSYRVHLLEDCHWSPSIASSDLAFTCDECSNRVTDDGVSITIDDDRYHFCCPSCRSAFEESATISESA
ncbi:AsnC family transcriptional regulator [Natronosalvus caseinilyticus]|uniref:AsnC family transcriptional regulator n=1 Tax=Natronosalvus caseinilyticus TaxID=2953747 RepID=UPI0028A7962E|nr:AsnC family transcriptional regulator [Natronosalvus caseinilyticus]